MSKNSERPSGGRIISFYLAAEEIEKLAEIVAATHEKRNAALRMIIREYKLA